MFPCRYGRRNFMNQSPGVVTTGVWLGVVVGLCGREVCLRVCVVVVLVEGLCGKPSAY